MTAFDISRWFYSTYGLVGILIVCASTVIAVRAGVQPRITNTVPETAIGFVLGVAMIGWRGNLFWIPFAVMLATWLFEILRPRPSLLQATLTGILTAGSLAIAPGWMVPPLGALTALPLATLAVDQVSRHRTQLLTDVLQLITAVGLFLTLPDTEIALLLCGVAGGYVAIGVALGRARVRGSTVSLLVMLLAVAAARHPVPPQSGWDRLAAWEHSGSNRLADASVRRTAHQAASSSSFTSLSSSFRPGSPARPEPLAELRWFSASRPC